ncbi:GNAT family N-acetyltransferase [Spirosoma validum]|uniref:GNAT family N-acetyltransferase n=1 Tax=Spirosoma validum TaxID=2771355 RepID=A0A927B1H4_9BACT|nr:GNAT family N-acetyltransferase [Spirosoma validum]MBD2753845.1 GNAT family N-acetyltransferase [Spirosoma validum]
MSITYTIKRVDNLSELEIATILKHWDIDEWKALPINAFRQLFKQSEFHLLTDTDAAIRCLARINFDFTISIDNELYTIAELVGLVATAPGKGYGRNLLSLIQENVKSRNINLISFCEAANRGFYQKCGILILLNKAKHLREPDKDEWLVPADDDILAINLSERNVNLLNSLNPEKLGYLVFS